MNYWWTSDYGSASLTTGYFSHFNIIRYCKRPFETAEEMNETIIKRHFVGNGGFVLGFAEFQHSSIFLGHEDRVEVGYSIWMELL
jgi:hypothetical protein